MSECILYLSVKATTQKIVNGVLSVNAMTVNMDPERQKEGHSTWDSIGGLIDTNPEPQDAIKLRDRKCVVEVLRAIHCARGAFFVQHHAGCIYRTSIVSQR